MITLLGRGIHKLDLLCILVGLTLTKAKDEHIVLGQGPNQPFALRSFQSLCATFSLNLIIFFYPFAYVPILYQFQIMIIEYGTK